jgi:hypothetical protein
VCRMKARVTIEYDIPRWDVAALGSKAYANARSSVGSLQRSSFDFLGALGRIRTADPQIRSLMLYPAELRARAGWFDHRGEFPLGTPRGGALPATYSASRGHGASALERNYWRLELQVA